MQREPRMFDEPGRIPSYKGKTKLDEMTDLQYLQIGLLLVNTFGLALLCFFKISDYFQAQETE